jgi:hypothetical protein
MTAKERWHPVVGGYEGLYEVSDLGRVLSVERTTRQLARYGPIERRVAERLLKPGRDRRTGHLRVRLYDGDGLATTVGVHQLVLAAFVGPRPPGYMAAWRNGDRTDCRLANLRWVPRRGQSRFRPKTVRAA